MDAEREHHATPGERFLSGLLDWCLWFTSNGVFSVAIAVVGAEHGPAVFLLAFGGLWVTFLAVCLLPVVRRGRTWGQRSVELWVRTVRTGTRPGFLRTLGREALWLAGLVLFPLGLLNLLWCYWDSRRQCLHDKLSGTVVVHVPHDEPLPRFTPKPKRNAGGRHGARLPEPDNSGSSMV